MSVWRRKAIECLPEFRAEFEQPDVTLYSVLFELLPATIEAHQNGENEKLRKIYGFAEWCHHQNEKEIWNAIDVAFYEHLADSTETRKSMHQWVSKEIYLEVRGLLELRVSNEILVELDNAYGIRNKKEIK